MEGHKIQWPSERSVNGRTDNTMAIRKKGKWKERPHNGHQKERQTTQATRKKSKLKDRQYNGHQKEG
jgi:hypothetical protein